MKLEGTLLQQLDDVLAEHKGLEARAKYEDLSDLAEPDVVRLITRARAAIHRVSGPSSPYVSQCEEIMKEKAYSGYKAIAGIRDFLTRNPA